MSLTQDQAKAIIGSKITSAEQFASLGLKTYFEYNVTPNSVRAAVYNHIGQTRHAMHWWAQREQLRRYLGHYQVSDAIDYIQQSFGFQYFLHISRDDDTMVAYTPSYEAGEADKQIKTTLGKFLRKHFLLITDAHIQEIEAAHRSEVNCEVFFATTRADIQHVYTNMAGDSGCMRYDPSKFGLPKDLHPSAVYEAPGMAVAYTKDHEGVIKSRSVVWTNPDDSTDMRYVRVYGDGKALRSKLEKLGFKESALNGAKLARIPFPKEGYDNHYLMPYLDGPGGRQSDYTGRYVKLDKNDERYVVITGSDEYERLSELSETCYCTALAGNHDSARVKLMPMPDLRRTCFLSNTQFDVLEEKALKFQAKDGRMVEVREQAIRDAGIGYTSAMTFDADAQRLAVYISTTQHDALKDVTDCVSYCGTYYIKSPEAYEHLGFQPLYAKFYPEKAGEYARNLYVVYDVETDTAGAGWVQPADVFAAVIDGEMHFVHNSQMALLRAKGYVNGSPARENVKTLLLPTADDTGKSIGGTYFSKSFCRGRFVELWDGRWELNTKVRSRTIFGSNFFFPKTEELPNDMMDRADIVQAAFPKTAYGIRFAEMHRTAMATSNVALVGDSLTEFDRLTLRAVMYHTGYVPYMRDDGVMSYTSSSSIKPIAFFNAINAARLLPETADISLKSTCRDALKAYDVLTPLIATMRNEILARKEAMDAALLAEIEAQRAAEAAAAVAAEQARTTLQQEIDRLLDNL